MRVIYFFDLLYPNILDDTLPYEREIALEMGKEMILKCDELWSFGNTISEGMFTEIDFAKENGIVTRRVELPTIEVSLEMRLC